MEQPVWLQGQRFGLALLLGLGLGLGYDLLRAPRRLHPGSTWLWDLVFSLGSFWALWEFTLRVGGGLFRIYQGLGVFLGLILWFFLVSPRLAPGWLVIVQQTERLILLFLRPFLYIFTFLQKYLKKYFASWVKWGTITCKMFHRRDLCRKKEGGNGSAVQTVILADKNSDPGAGCVRRRYPGFSAEPGGTAAAAGCRAGTADRS